MQHVTTEKHTHSHTLAVLLIYFATPTAATPVTNQYTQTRLTYVAAGLHEAAVERRVAVGPLQQRHHRFGIHLPPHEQVVRVQVGVGRRGVTFDLALLSVVRVVPWLRLAQEVNYLRFVAVPVHRKR